MNKRKIEVIASSGNVFADTGHRNPQEAMAKAELAILIINAIKKKKLTQKQAAELIGVDLPKVSDIVRGRLSGFTIDRLFRFLMALGMDIVIEAKPHKQRSSEPFILVMMPHHHRQAIAA